MNKFRYTINGTPYEVEVERFQGNEADILVNGTKYVVQIERKKPTVTQIVRPKVVSGAGPQPVRLKPEGGPGLMTSPLPGTIRSVRVKEGDAVKQGQIVLTLEAMKMENEIYASADGRVSRIFVAANQSVLEGDQLFLIES